MNNNKRHKDFTSCRSCFVYEYAKYNIGEIRLLIFISRETF
jgi:hypothetical protein